VEVWSTPEGYGERPAIVVDSGGGGGGCGAEGDEGGAVDFVDVFGVVAGGCYYAAGDGDGRA